MLILNMLLRITGFTQEKLANFLGVSRASINAWLSDDTGMTDSSKINIAHKFQFPVSYFDIDLNQDLNLYKVVFSTLYESWKRMDIELEEETSNSKIDNILNNIEFDMKKVESIEATEDEIIDALINSYDPFTGEIFENDHILNNEKVKKVLISLRKNYLLNKTVVAKANLTDEQLKLFEKLRLWRKNKYVEEGFFSAFMVFTDKELINIVTANINSKSDLLKVKGIGLKKYSKYADELYEFILFEKDNKK